MAEQDRNNMARSKRCRPFTLLALLVAGALASLVPHPAVAVEPDEMLSDPQLESRARDISEHLRCLVCQNETIDDSNAPLAKDLRVLVRERLTKGDSNEQTVQYIVDRYGEYVLLKPRLNAHTLILWLGPLLLLLAGASYFYLVWQRRPGEQKSAAPRALSPEERAKLARLLKED